MIKREMIMMESCIETMKKQFNRLHKNNSHIFISVLENKQLIGSVMGVIFEELYGDCKLFLVLENMIVDKKGIKGEEKHYYPRLKNCH